MVREVSYLFVIAEWAKSSNHVAREVSLCENGLIDGSSEHKEASLAGNEIA